MSSNPNIINLNAKDQLLEDMMGLSNESNFYSYLQQILKQIIQCRTLSPYLYLHKKSSLKSKFDNTKPSQYLCEIALYLSSINPLILTKQTITNKLMSFCIDKFNHLKIKKFQINQFINFLLIDLGQKEKQQFIHEVNEQKLQNDNISVMIFANIMYWTVVYLWTVKELNQLTNKLKVAGGGMSSSSNNNITESLINAQILNDYLNNVDEQDSMLKMLRIEVKEGQSIQSMVIQKIFQLFDGNQKLESQKK